MASHFFVERPSAWGVTRIYGYPGDSISGGIGALQRAEKEGSGIKFIQVRHEEKAAFMGVAHAIFTGEFGASHEKASMIYEAVWIQNDASSVGKAAP